VRRGKEVTGHPTRKADFRPDLQSVVKRATQDSGFWSMKTDRELIVLSKTKTIEALADHFQRPPKSILDKAKRLGLSIKAQRKVKMKHGPRPKRSKRHLVRLIRAE
jgi:hypothetical protein